MPRRRTHVPLNVLINNRLCGRLEKQASGAISFQYDPSWLEWKPAFPISLSLPLQEAPWRGEAVVAVFDNLLPDNPHVRRQVAERTGAEGADAYSLLAQIGRDCVGAMQFLPDGEAADALQPIQGTPISDEEIEALLANLARAPLGIDPEQEFRISVAGAQEKTALLRHDGQWMRPIGTTPTTHILKPQLGEIPTSSGVIDLSDSVENEHYCLTLLESFGLPIAKTEIATFGARRVLVVERFDRRRRGEQLLRLPQEDFCQALSTPSSRKYQRDTGPGVVDILTKLQESDDPLADQAKVFKSQIVFWLIGATDGHAKNFSVFLRPGGRFELTPFYDVLSAQPAFDAKRIPHKGFTLAMSAGARPHYKILEVHGRHFVEMAKAAGLGPTITRQVLEEVLAAASGAAAKALQKMPPSFPEAIHNSVAGAIQTRLPRLESAWEAI
ncbi:type II toxin-antitoxin system HipA family toxin [Phenylobacterium ferrooxidans]|uniref:Type II toxin-antitoxin system HipA family toxin n=1 Tax=Phenylobacterium ferrooxidans TaxID=2982689 RepID=A0ABW6D124_9CAUL